MELLKNKYQLLQFISMVFISLCCTNKRGPNFNSAVVNINDIGIVKQNGTFDSLGNKKGKWTGYFSNDSIGYIGFYENGVRDSVWVYYNYLGVIEKKEQYFRGLKNGITSYYSEGILYDEVEFKDDKKNGRHTHYYGPDKVNFYQEYKDGFFDGIYTLFYEDGKVKQKGKFKMGRCVGEWLLFSNNGEVVEKTIYDSLSTKYREIKYSLNGKIISDEIK